MSGMMTFGWEETVRCLQELSLPGPDGEPLCLAHKLSVRHFVGPVYVTDDGYVLASAKGRGYRPLDAHDIAELQASGRLSTPLPRYSLSVFDYLGGYALWIILALAIGLVVALARGRRRREAAVPEIPISTRPPELTTDGDRFIAAQVVAQLGPRERVTHQAYGLAADAEPALINIGIQGTFAALTEARVILIETRVSPFRIRLENRGVETIDRSRIVAARRHGRKVLVQLSDGTVRQIVVDLRTKRFSNQAAFLLDVPRLLAAPVA